MSLRKSLKLNEVIKQRKRLQRGHTPEGRSCKDTARRQPGRKTPQQNPGLPTLDLRHPASSTLRHKGQPPELRSGRACEQDALCNLPFPALGTVTFTLLTVVFLSQAGSGAVNAEIQRQFLKVLRLISVPQLSGVKCIERERILTASSGKQASGQ